MVVLWTSAQLKNHPSDDLSQYLPKNSKFAIRVYSDNILKAFIKELFFYKADDSNQNEIEKYIEKFISTDDQSTERPQNIIKNLKGVDFFNDLLFFHFSDQNMEFNGVLCHITDSVAFKANDTKNRLFWVESNKSVGIILQATNEKAQGRALKQIAQKILITKNHHKLSPRRSSSEALADVYVNINGAIEASELTLEIDGNSEKINFKGKIKPFDSKIDKNPVYVLQGKNLSWSLRYIPETLKKELRSWCAQNNIPNIDLREIQMNYEGLDVAFMPGNLAIQPKFEAIFKTENCTKIKNFLSDTVVLEKIGGKFEEHFISINNTKYYFEQLDSCTFYLGNHSNPVFEKRYNPELMSIRGELRHLTNIQTGGMDFLLNLVPLYAATNRYFTNSEKINLKITPKADTSLIEGVLDFKKNKSAFFESFFLFLETQELNKHLK
jgi:hypothetical protein